MRSGSGAIAGTVAASKPETPWSASQSSSRVRIFTRASPSTTAVANWIAMRREGISTNSSISTSTVKSSTPSAMPSATGVYRPGSRDDNGRPPSPERGADVLETLARGLPLAGAERVMTEARDLEQPRQPFHGGRRHREAREQLPHELVRRLPRLPSHLRARRRLLEPPIAARDGRPRIRVRVEVVERLVDGLRELHGLVIRLSREPPLEQTIAEQHQQRDREREERDGERDDADAPPDPGQRDDRLLDGADRGAVRGPEPGATEPH